MQVSGGILRDLEGSEIPPNAPPKSSFQTEAITATASNRFTPLPKEQPRAKDLLVISFGAST